MTDPLQVEGRLPAVLRSAQLLGLRALAGRMNCNIADLLVALFCMVTKGAVAFAANDAGDVLAAQPPGGLMATTQAVASYLLWVPRILMQAHQDVGQHTSAGAVRQTPPTREDTSAAKADGLGAIAFLYARTSVGRTDTAVPASLSSKQDEPRLAQAELVAQVTEFDHHLLVEYLFDPKQVDHRSVARLVFQYSSALERLARPLA